MVPFNKSSLAPSMSFSPPDSTPSDLCLPHQGRAILNYLHRGEMQRTVHETFEHGHPNSHDENTCLTCQARREPEEPMQDVESVPAPRHSDYEDDFAEAGLGKPPYDDDNEEETYETTCSGIRDIIFTGEVRHLFCIDPLISTNDPLRRRTYITAWLGDGIHSLAECARGMA